MKIQRFTGSISFLPGKIFVHNQGRQPINTGTDRAILKDNEMIISINPVDQQAAGLLKLLTNDAITFTGSFTYAGKKQSEAMAVFEYYDNEKSAILLGEWTEDAQIYTCLISLLKVSQFPEVSNSDMLKFI
jgi:hypothetical protein